MNTLILNDVHLGVVRTAGTTRESQFAIQAYLQDVFRSTILQHIDKDLLINGDLFDGFDVDSGQLLLAYLTLYDWLKVSGKQLTLVQGNHDIAKNSLRTSSFAMLCELLLKSFPEQVTVYDSGFAHIRDNLFVIPHVTNQDIFDIELQKAFDCDERGYLFLHANVDNKFAVEADHSLNVSDEWLRKLTKSGWTLVFAHEHQKRHLMAGQVQVLGNQWPSSIADCLSHGEAQKDGCKYAHEIIDGVLQATTTWEADDDFAVMPWDDLQETTARFIRITGKVDAERAAEVISAVSKYRQKSDAFVITNSVEVAGMAGIGDMATMSVEKLQALDVLEALCDELTPTEGAKVRELLASEGGQ